MADRYAVRNAAREGKRHVFSCRMVRSPDAYFIHRHTPIAPLRVTPVSVKAGLELNCTGNNRIHITTIRCVHDFVYLHLYAK
jgi:hypothetical protein